MRVLHYVLGFFSAYRLAELRRLRQLRDDANDAYHKAHFAEVARRKATGKCPPDSLCPCGDCWHFYLEDQGL